MPDFIVTRADGSEQRITAERFQTLQDGSLAFGKGVPHPQFGTVIDAHHLIHSREWSELKIAAVQSRIGDDKL